MAAFCSFHQALSCDRSGAGGLQARPYTGQALEMHNGDPEQCTSSGYTSDELLSRLQVRIFVVLAKYPHCPMSEILL